jgi:iron(III) transport system substrate-binding protein
VALTNSYYFARMMQSDKPEDIAAISKLGFVWPNQGSGGVHVNIAGGGMARNTPHPKEAIQFLEYLATNSAQEYFANGNNEWPAVPSVRVENPALKTLGNFQAEKVSVASIGKNQIAAQRLLDQVGYK